MRELRRLFIRFLPLTFEPRSNSFGAAFWTPRLERLYLSVVETAVKTTLVAHSCTLVGRSFSESSPYFRHAIPILSMASGGFQS